MDWWNSLTDLQRLFASIAAPATLFMILQFIMLLFGFAHGSDTDSADHGDNLDSHAHDIFSGNDHDAADGHAHDIFSGHGHDVADGHAHDIFSGHGHDVTDGHVHDINSGHDHDGLDSHTAHDGVHASHGEDSHHTAEGHDKTDALRLFTLRGIIAFLSIGGWMGVAAIDWNISNILAVVLALAAGWLALWFVAWTIRAFVRMQQSGNVNMENAVGRDGEVYLTIPENGHGKVNVIVQDRLCEMDAVTKAGRSIKTGEKITVLGIASEGVLLVAPKASRERSPEPKSLHG